MLSHKNLQEQIKKSEPNKQRFAIKKLTVGVASVLLGVTFAGTASADTTNANSASGSASDGAEQTDHNLVLNSASTTTMKQATAAADVHQAAAATNPAGNIKTPVANGYEAVVNAAVSAAMKNTDSASTEPVSASAAVQQPATAASETSLSQNNNETQSSKTETFLPTTTPSSEYTFSTQSLAEEKVPAASLATKENVNQVYKITIKTLNVATGQPLNSSNAAFQYNFKNGVLTKEGKTGDYLYSLGVAPTGYKLLNPEILADNFTMNGNMANIKNKDVDITLKYAPISPILVRYIDEDTGEVLSTSSVGANTSSTASYAYLNGDEKQIGPSKFLLHAIEIPGYTLDDQATFIDTYNNVQSKGNLNYQVHTFKYKKIMNNPNPKESQKGSGATYGEYFGPEWDTIDPADIFTVSGVYGQNYEKDNGDMEAKMNHVISKYENQGYTYMGTFNYHRNADWYNWNEGGTSINLIPNKAVTVKFVDEQGNKLADDQTIAFNNDNPDQTNNGINPASHWFAKGEWHSTPKSFDGYVLRTTYGADHGQFTPYQYVVTYEYAKKAEAEVKYIDDTDNKQLSADELNGFVGDPIDYSTKASIANYEKQGYVLVNDGFVAGSKYADGNNVFEVHFKHGIKDGTPATATVTRTIEYQYADGKKAADTKVQKAEFNSNVKVDAVTGALVSEEWSAPQELTAVTSPEIKGYTPDQRVVSQVTVDHSAKNIKVTVTYRADEANADVTYIDKTTGKTLETKVLNGKVDDHSDYTTTATIKKYEDKGYQLVADNYPQNGITFTPETQHYTVYFEHTYGPVNPENPNKNIDPVEYSKDVKSTVHYVGAGDKNPADNVQTSKWARTLTIDKVTNQLVAGGQYDTNWAIVPGEKTEYDQVNTPVIDGFHADKANVPSAKVTQENLETTVTYAPNGKIIPVDPSGKPIPNAPTPQYPTNPTDPTGVTPNEPVPSVPGFVPEVPTVTPTDPGKDTPVVYNQIQKADLTIVDQDNGNKQIIVPDVTTKFNADGIANDKIGFNGYGDSITALENMGYEYVSSDYSVNENFDDDANADQHFIITMKHGIQPVNPTNPGKPGQPINPNDPDGPKYPQGSDQVTKNVTRTIQYVDENGNKISDPVEQTVNFTAEGVLDKVTGQWKTPLTWSDPQKVAEVVSPTIDGMHVVSVSQDSDGNDVKAVELNHNSSSYMVVVKYAKNSLVEKDALTIPASQTIKFVDESGNTLRENNVQTSEFTRTPDVVDTVTGKTITEGSWNETSHKFGTINVPVIDGYVATVKTAGGLTATTENPNVVTEVVYKKVGKIIPVDPSGKPIPNVPTPSYPNDPTDPTTVTPDEPVPS
ncbi:MucBP domain-containing protein, partial [Limosilactobacillus sp. STM2_1]